MTDAERWKATVHVGGLAVPVTQSNIHDAFIPFGEIADISFPKNDNPKTGDNSHRGFAYVEFEDAEDAKEAIDNMHHSEFFGRTMKVTLARVPKSADEGLGSKRAVWEQEGWLAKHAASAEEQPDGVDDRPDDPMQGLEGLDEAGPKPQ